LFFQGKVAHKSIFVQSSFSYKTKVDSLVPVSPADDRFYFKKKDSIKTEVEPNKKTKVRWCNFFNSKKSVDFIELLEDQMLSVA